jgi:hypothetical protein
MKVKEQMGKTKAVDWEVVAEETRRRCNKLSEQDRRRYRAEALRLVYNSDAEATARRGRH